MSEVQGLLSKSSKTSKWLCHSKHRIEISARSVAEKLNDAEVEYSECRGVLSPDDPPSRDTLIGRVAGNAADVWERSSDESAKMAC